MGRQRCCRLAPCLRCRAVYCRWRQRTAGIGRHRQSHRGIAMVSMRLPQMRAYPWTLWAPRLSWASRYCRLHSHARHAPDKADVLCLCQSRLAFSDGAVAPVCGGSSGAQCRSIGCAAQDAEVS